LVSQIKYCISQSNLRNILTDHVEPVFEESLMGHMVHIESPELEIILTCTVYGGVDNAVDIVWSGPAVNSQPAIMDINDGNYTSNLILTNVTMFFSGVYECTARYVNSLCTTSISSDLRLDVIAPPSVIFQTASPHIVNSGINVNFQFRFLAHPSFTDVTCNSPTGDNITSSTPGISFTRVNNNDAFEITLFITVFNVLHAHGGDYACIATNIAGSITAMTLLIVRPDVIPQQVLARNGDNVSLICSAQSLPEPSFTWKNVGNNDSDSIPDIFSSSIGSGENTTTNSSLIFEPIQYQNAGVYRCVVNFNAAALEISSNGTLLAGDLCKYHDYTELHCTKRIQPFLHFLKVNINVAKEGEHGDGLYDPLSGDIIQLYSYGRVLTS
jgi:hypothetical protein